MFNNSNVNESFDDEFCYYIINNLRLRQKENGEFVYELKGRGEEEFLEISQDLANTIVLGQISTGIKRIVNVFGKGVDFLSSTPKKRPRNSSNNNNTSSKEDKNTEQVVNFLMERTRKATNT